MKKLKIMFLLLFLLFCLASTEINAQNLLVRMKDGTENNNLLSTVHKLGFSDGNLLLTLNNGSTETFGLSTIQKLYFDLQTSVTENTPPNECKLTVFPNPVENAISIQNIPEGTTSVFIYRVDGKLLLKTQISSEKETIDVSNLKCGLYMIVANGEAVKFIKL
jgi:hypothetical protein